MFPKRSNTLALADELQALRVNKPRTFEQWCQIAEPDEIEMVQDAITDRTLMPDQLAAVLRANGVPITRRTILRMREEA